MNNLAYKKDYYIIHKPTNIKQINKNKSNWKRIKLFGKCYRLNPEKAELYETIGGFLAVVLNIVGFIFLFNIL